MAGRYSAAREGGITVEEHLADSEPLAGLGGVSDPNEEDANLGVRRRREYELHREGSQGQGIGSSPCPRSLCYPGNPLVARGRESLASAALLPLSAPTKEPKDRIQGFELSKVRTRADIRVGGGGGAGSECNGEGDGDG